MTAIYRTAVLSFIFTLVVCSILVIIPETFLSIFTHDALVISNGKEILPILIVIIFACSVATVMFNGVMGTGSMLLSLLIETIGMVIYLSYAYIVAKIMLLGLPYVWTAEFLYWLILVVPSWWYLQSGKWEKRTM